MTKFTCLLCHFEREENEPTLICSECYDTYGHDVIDQHLSELDEFFIG